ncbi:uncharacterized protein HKW66_Vig0148200 [Vigna angularis]|uniref:Uncharacterized protein n=2 Tax=Phaseolus angularis TaxID=3914 RepID=A0A8T0JUY0_PHAAN|nr:uncharacterized protein LOC108345665 isoform X1 [Vigna angularis]KAG2384416.1 uncharacterized protein HKW66_Vig0148200 [Vigna angularis]BAU01724.1 hypothetical protein VIGAN_11101800 [Vigna angularis var. angularis]
MRLGGGKRRRVAPKPYVVFCALVTGLLGLLLLTFRPLEDAPRPLVPFARASEFNVSSSDGGTSVEGVLAFQRVAEKACKTVEEMGEDFGKGVGMESLRVRKIIENHFVANGALRVRDFPPEQFCRHGFVLGKTAEAGFGNEMYKVLTAAALSVMLNRSLIIGQTRGKYPFGDYISYSNFTFTVKEIKHLWRQKGCESKYGRKLVMRIDDFNKPLETNVLCSNWKKWKQPIIWFQGTTDSVAAQFFLKNIYSQMRIAAFNLFGDPEVLGLRPNVFGELMRVLISPSEDVDAAVNWVIGGGENPDISLHMRMLMNRSGRAVQAVLRCLKKAIRSQHLMSSRPKVVLVSDTPAVVKSIMSMPNISEFAEVLHFDYDQFKGSMSKGMRISDFRRKDWGSAPRWVAFVDFFLASRAKFAAISGAHRRVGTTYAQLIAALGAAYNLGDKSGSRFLFFSSFQSNLLRDGLKHQVGWGHVWNRYAGPLSCRNQANQCAFTPVLPSAWWDGLWQSPIPRDINRLASYGIRLSGLGNVDSNSLKSHCKKRKNIVRTITFKL